MTPAAAARRAPLTPNSASRAGRPNCSSAHRPSCSTPTLRGRTRRSESTSTRCTSVGSAAVPSRGAPRASNCAAMRWASCSTAGGPSASRDAWPDKMSSMRAHNGGHWTWGMSKWRPRLSRVRWRTVFPDALGVHQAMGEVGFSVLGPPGLCAPNEHAAHDSGRGGRSQPIQYDYGTTSRTVKTRSFRINNLQTWQSRNIAKIGKMAGQLGKLGLTPSCGSRVSSLSDLGAANARGSDLAPV